MLIVFAGMPGSGKSTLAARLAARLGAHVLDKDRIRDLLYGPFVAYDDRQNDHCVAVAYDTASRILNRAAEHGPSARRGSARHVVLDGRTYGRRYQIEALVEFAAALETDWRLVECTCSEAVALERLSASTGHPAADRGPALYHRARARHEPITIPRIVVDTEALDPDSAVERILTDLALPAPMHEPAG